MTGTPKKAGATEAQYASDKQKALIIKLYGELKLRPLEQFSLDELNHLEKQIAEEHIDHLIKTRRKQQNHTEERVNGFDKISFAMIYKLCWRRSADQSADVFFRLTEGFREAVRLEYKAYKEAAAYTKKKVEGGQQ